MSPLPSPLVDNIFEQESNGGAVETVFGAMHVHGQQTNDARAIFLLDPVRAQFKHSTKRAPSRGRYVVGTRLDTII